MACNFPIIYTNATQIEWTNEERFVVESGKVDAAGRTMGVIVTIRHVSVSDGMEVEEVYVKGSRNGRHFGAWSALDRFLTRQEAEDFAADTITKAMDRIRKAA